MRNGSLNENLNVFCIIINLDGIIDQFNVDFYQNLVFAENDDEIREEILEGFLGLNGEQLAYLFEKSTDLNEDIKIELSERAIDYLEEQRKEVENE